MCGIAGVVNAAGTTKDDVWKMIDCIKYRGVDEQGVEDLGQAVLGHARLAVVDPENGMQPMSSTDGKVWVVFNGEIFNFIELREQLKAKGYKFKSRCDTEVLVHLWCEKGEKMLDDLVGMFAFFIWDQRTETGMLARDRQGIKPCFYAPYQGGLAFASEIKAILALPKFKRKVNE
ncbi:asparagine synthetase B family protein, partial [Polaromonas sp. P5_E6]